MTSRGRDVGSRVIVESKHVVPPKSSSSSFAFRSVFASASSASNTEAPVIGGIPSSYGSSSSSLDSARPRLRCFTPSSSSTHSKGLPPHSFRFARVAGSSFAFAFGLAPAPGASSPDIHGRAFLAALRARRFASNFSRRASRRSAFRRRSRVAGSSSAGGGEGGRRASRGFGGLGPRRGSDSTRASSESEGAAPSSSESESSSSLSSLSSRSSSSSSSSSSASFFVFASGFGSSSAAPRQRRSLRRRPSAAAMAVLTLTASRSSPSSGMASKSSSRVPSRRRACTRPWRRYT